MLPLTKKELKSHQVATECCICVKHFIEKIAKVKNYSKVKDPCYYTAKYKDAAHSICNLRFYMCSEILVMFHSGSNCDYHFIIKELAK